jgi:hypothetical protein
MISSTMGECRSSLTSLLIQVLISSRNALIFTNNALPSIRASTKPVTLTHINHYTIQKSVYTSERYKASPMEELILKKNEEQTQYRI